MMSWREGWGRIPGARRRFGAAPWALLLILDLFSGKFIQIGLSWVYALLWFALLQGGQAREA